MNWMAWTLPTVAFFSIIAVILVCMTVWEVRSPCVDRRGFLPISTTRGDRLFIGLLVSAYIHLAVIGLTEWSIWIAFGVSLVWMFIVMKWG
ncbi:membrane protein [Pokkaliibacter plantistimulans]|uniref:Membrane protein n=1 Tax=Pokkaliibacter plantistimulans TaxID=1635171 RepID=A0ABX5LRG7_9GAMM|nr:DUF2160 domain-containing protein [Pokkaliibacter plantistimulans]PXF28802.1 membrane protein [Pokkaliibacter plantistimulans]